MTHCWEHFTFAKHSLSPTHPSTEQCPALVLRSEKNSCLWNAGSKITPCPQQRVPGAESTAGVQRCHCPGMRLCTKTNTATAAKWLVFGWHRLVSAHSTCKKNHKILRNVAKKKLAKVWMLTQELLRMGLSSHVPPRSVRAALPCSVCPSSKQSTDGPSSAHSTVLS